MTRNQQSRFPVWALWIIGAVTLLAVALLILAVVLGVRAGQQQLEMQRRQQVGIALQQALDFSAEGNLEAALDAYQHVLLLDPGNKTAVEGINNLLHLATGATPKPNTPGPANQRAVTNTVPVSSTVAPTAVAANNKPNVDEMMRTAQTNFDAGRWQDAISQLLRIQQTNATYAADQISALLFKAYVNLANERDNEDRLEEALTLYDNALALRPNDANTSRERAMIAKYLEMQSYYGVNWPHTVELLKTLYEQEPDYRDVADRLQSALVNYGDELAEKESLCPAAEQYAAAIEIKVTSGLIAKRDQAQKLCDDGKSATSSGTVTATLASTHTATPTTIVAQATGTLTEAASVATVATATPTEEPVATGDKPSQGRLLYSAHDSATGHNRIMLQVVGSNAAPTLFHDNAAQPALRPDGQRLVFRNVRTDMGGLSAIDPATGMLLRFTEFPEDSQPSWSPQGNRIVFSSNREGDRRWRVYVMWAETNGQVTKLDFGQSPQWSPTQDQIVFNGCDTSGNRCGLWLINSSGSNGSPLTTVPVDDRPTWSPDGRFVVFTSNGRDGNFEIYRADVSSGQILRLTDNPGIDTLPAVSPDGGWVAFVSNRDGAWKLWAVPLSGGAAVSIAPINGDMGNWPDQDIQWVN